VINILSIAYFKVLNFRFTSTPRSPKLRIRPQISTPFPTRHPTAYRELQPTSSDSLVSFP
jgi:hypothetical protein